MRIGLLSLMSSFWVLFTGCQSGSEPEEISGSDAAPVAAPRVRAGETVTFAEARNRAMLLETGMTPEQVLRILGEPARKHSRVFGRQTLTPWPGQEWTYRWEGRESEFDVVFQEVGVFLRLNHWGWD